MTTTPAPHPSRFFRHVQHIAAQFAAIETPRQKVRFGIIVFALILPFYLFGTIIHATDVNTKSHRYDQSAYMNYAIGLHHEATTGQNFTGDRNRMPLYPSIQAVHYNPDESYQAYFGRGKGVNIALSVVILAGVWAIFLAYFRPVIALHFLLITTFTLFIFRAPYFQGELLFYGLTFVVFVVMYELFRRPSWRLGIAGGVVLGLAHLTKGSVMLGLAVFGVAFTLEGARRVYHARRPNTRQESWGWGWRQFPALPLASVVVMFLIVIYPYLRTSKVVFGSYFYNVNTTFYIWYDSWDEVTSGTRAHGDRVGYPQMPAAEIPSFHKYMREHTLGDIVARFGNGFANLLKNHCGPASYGYCKYLLAYGVLAGVLWRKLRRENRPRWREMWRQHWPWVLFCLGYFGVYGAAYAWYVPIASGPRFLQALFLPYLFVIGLALRVPEIEGYSYKRGELKIGQVQAWFVASLPVVVLDAALIVGLTIRYIGDGS